MLPRRKATGVQRRRNSLLMESLKERRDKFILQKRFTARAGHASSELLVVITITKNLNKQCLKIVLLTLQTHSRGWAGLGAGTAFSADIPSDTNTLLFKRYRSVWTSLPAGAAADAVCVAPPYLVMRGNAFGILTP